MLAEIQIKQTNVEQTQVHKMLRGITTSMKS